MKTLIIIALFAFVVLSQERIPIWEKHGITRKEWMIADSFNVSIPTLDSLTSIGVNVHIFLAKPWEKFNLSYIDWYKMKRKNYHDSRIEKESKKLKYRIKNKIRNR